MDNDTLRIQRIQRNLGVERPREATLGDASGVIYEPGKPGFVRVTYVTSSAEDWPQTVRRSLSPLAYRAKMPVLVYFDRDIGEYRVKPNDQAMSVSGANPFLNDVVPDPSGGFLDLTKVVPLYTAPTTPPSLSVTVKSLFYELAGVVHLFGGDGAVDLTSYVPGTAGYRGLAGLFLVPATDTVEVVAGTPKPAIDEFTLSDVQELFTGSTSGSLPVGIWTLSNGMTEITDQDRFLLDPRQFVNVPVPHNSGIGLQGGTAGEYYHLTAAEYAALGTGSGSDRPVFRWLGV